MHRRWKINKVVSVHIKFNEIEIEFYFRFYDFLFSKGSESDSEYEHSEEDSAHGFDASAFDDIDTDEPTGSETPQERRKTPKRNWITPRLCSALDKAKVKRMRLKK